MKKLALAVAALALPISVITPAEHAGAADVAPTITKIDLAFDQGIISANSPCVTIPITIDFANNGDFVYSFDVYATHGTLPTDLSAPSAQVTVPLADQATATTATGTFQYCPQTQGVGKLDAGPSVIHYSPPDGHGEVLQNDPATEVFYVQQASTAYLKIHRHHKNVTLQAAETYYNYTNGAIKGTTSQAAHFQVLGKHNKWVSFAKKKPNAKGLATVKVSSKKPRNYRVAFEPSASIEAAVSDVVTK